MIERLLQAERLLTVGQLDAAERLYWQAIESDPRNSIAVVGLARVALDRGDDRTAYQFARKALEIDGENAAAQRLVARLREVMQYRGEQPPTEPTPTLRERPSHGATQRTHGATQRTHGATQRTGACTAAPGPGARSAPTAGPPGSSTPSPKRRGLLGRILGR